MAGAAFRVLEAGPHVSIQDGGRHGFLRFGVPASGPMDRFALKAANRMLGNRLGAPGVEVSLTGLTLECCAGETMVAVGGGGFLAELDGVALGNWLRFPMRQGSRLRLRPGRWGNWACLAVSGGIETNSWLNSAATHALSGLGGGAVLAGQTLIAGQAQEGLTALRRFACPVFARPRHEVRVVLGPQDRFFSPASVAAFLGQSFALTDAYDRMGVRLRGPLMRPESELSMPSEAVVRGSVQIAGDGVAAVLLADHQTTGGYPKIATVLDCDIDGLVQQRSHAVVGFKAVSAMQAIVMSRLHTATCDRYLDRIAPG